MAGGYNFHPVPEDMVLRQLRRAMFEHGVIPLDGIDSFEPKWDGKIHRFDVEGDRRGEKTGAYKLYSDGCPAGWIQDHRITDIINWHFDYTELKDNARHQDAYRQSQTSEFKAATKAKQEERKRLEKEEKLRASDAARAYFTSCKSAQEDHPYLVRKHVAKYGDLREANGDLLIPLYDDRGRFKTFQRIAPNGKKLFREGTASSGGRFTIAGDVTEGPIQVVEGYATGASAYEATGLMTVAAFCSGNLLSVAQSLRKLYPGRKIIILADDDVKTKEKIGENPGLAAAFKCVKEKAADDVIPPPFDRGKDGLAPSDWNDYAAIYGEDATEKTLKGAIEEACKSKEGKAQGGMAVLMRPLSRDAEVPDVEYIGGMFPRKRISMIFSEPGVGKTWLTLRMATDLSNGGAFLASFSWEPAPTRCLIFAGEAGYDILVQRAKITGWAPDENFVRVVSAVEGASNGVELLLDTDMGRANIEAAIDLFKPEIVFIDTFVSFHGSDESKMAEMKPIFDYLLKLAEERNIAVVLMHHCRKRKSLERGRPLTMDDVIGSSIFIRLAALIVVIEKIDAPDGDLTRKINLVKVLKSWYRSFEPFTFEIIGGDMAEGVLTRMEIDLDPALEILGGLKQKIWDFIKRTYTPGEWFKIASIIQSVKSGAAYTRRCLGKWVEEGELQRRGEKKNTEYSLPTFYTHTATEEAEYEAKKDGGR